MVGYGNVLYLDLYIKLVLYFNSGMLKWYVKTIKTMTRGSIAKK